MEEGEKIVNSQPILIMEKLDFIRKHHKGGRILNVQVKRFFAIIMTFLLMLTGTFSVYPPAKAEAADAHNGDWSKPYVALYNTSEADLMVRVGDIDNLGFGWESNYDPFSGNSTKAHSVTFKNKELNDPQGTDQLMVISAFSYPSLRKITNPDLYADGYTRENNYSLKAHPVAPVNVNYDLKSIKVESAILQMFIDDYQPRKPEEVTGIKPRSIKYTVKLDGVRAPFIENMINSLNQHGPVGKLISVQIPDEYLPLLIDGRLSIYMDDKTTFDAYGDGAAIDFVKLLINPVQLKKTGTIKGRITDEQTKLPISNATVSAGGVVTTQTNSNGEYTLTNVPAGLVIVEASKVEYLPKTRMVEDFAAGTTATNIDLTLTKRTTNNADLSNLTVKSGTLVPLEPGFDKTVTSYEVHLDSNVPHVEITPTTDDRKATLQVNGESHASGTAKVISLNQGETVVAIQVTAQDKNTKKTYQLKIHTPVTNFQLTRAISKEEVKLNEPAVITYTVTPEDINDSVFATLPNSSASYIRPFFLLNQSITSGSRINIETELNKIPSSGNSNNGGLDLEANGKPGFERNMQNGYKPAVSVGQTLKTEPSAKVDDIVGQLLALIDNNVTQITIPLADVTDVLNGKGSIRVAGFATLQLEKVKLSNTDKKGNKDEYEVWATYQALSIAAPPSTFVVKDLTFSEVFPANIDLVSSQSDVTGSLQNGRYTVSLPDVTYTKQGNVYKANRFSFKIAVKSDDKGTYLFNDSKLAYTEQGSIHITKHFNNLTLKVDQAAATGVTISPDHASIDVGETVTLSASVVPADADQTVTWNTRDSEIATVRNGVVTGLKAGVATITATSSDGKITASAEITVQQPVTGITLDKSELTLMVTDEADIMATVLPGDATNQQVRWTSSNSTVATVSPSGTDNKTGKIQALKTGTTTITATVGVYSATCVVTVVNKTQFNVYYDQALKQKVPNPNNWLNQPVYVELVYPDRMNKRVELNGQAFDYTQPFLVNREGINEIKYYEKINSNNPKTEHIKLDFSVPSLSITGGTIDVATKTVKDITIALGNGESNDFDTIEVWTSDNPTPTLYKHAPLLYSTSPTNNQSITVYAKAYDKSGNVGPETSKRYTFDSQPPVVSIDNSFIRQATNAPNYDNNSVISLQVNVNDDVSGVDKVEYTIRKMNVDSSGNVREGKVVETGRLSDAGGSIWEVSDLTVNDGAGFYKVEIVAYDKVDNKSEVVDTQWGTFLISPGFTLAKAPVVSALTSYKPITITMEKQNGSYFASSIARPNEAGKDSLDNLFDGWDWHIDKVEYAIVDISKPSQVKWMPLKSSQIVITEPNKTFEVYVRITDNYNRRGGKPVSTIHKLPYQFRIKSTMKKL